MILPKIPTFWRQKNINIDKVITKEKGDLVDRV